MLRPNAAALNPVLQGAKAVVFGAVDYISYGRANSGESIEVIVPHSGTVIAPRPMMILQSTRNPDAAKAFFDYVLSDEGQKLVANTWMMPARADVEGLRPGISDINVIEVDEEAVAVRRDEIISRLLPYPIRYAIARLRQISGSLDDAARVAGASPVLSLRHITLPMLAPALIAAMMLVFAIASRELVASIMLAPAGVRTIGTFVFAQFEQGSVQTGMAMSVIAIAITSSILLAANLWLARQGSSPFSG